MWHKKNYMKVLKDFTEKGKTKRWHKGEEYTGEREKELAGKGLLGKSKPKEKEETEKEEEEVVKEKAEVTISTEKVKK